VYNLDYFWGFVKWDSELVN